MLEGEPKGRHPTPPPRPRGARFAAATCVRVASGSWQRHRVGLDERPRREQPDDRGPRRERAGRVGGGCRCARRATRRPGARARATRAEVRQVAPEPGLLGEGAAERARRARRAGRRRARRRAPRTHAIAGQPSGDQRERPQRDAGVVGEQRQRRARGGRERVVRRGDRDHPDARRRQQRARERRGDERAARQRHRALSRVPVPCVGVVCHQIWKVCTPVKAQPWRRPMWTWS